MNILMHIFWVFILTLCLLHIWLIVFYGFKGSGKLARLIWVVSTSLSLFVGSWAYYDEFKVAAITSPEASFQIKHTVSLWRALDYGVPSFIGVWAIYFILKWLALGVREDKPKDEQKQ